MSYSTIRAAIKTKMETISGIENVQDFVIWTDDWDDLLSYFVKAGRVNTWQIGLTSIPPLQVDAGNRMTTHNINLFGLYSIKTDAESSKTFEDLCIDVINAFAVGHNPVDLVGVRQTTFPAMTSFENAIFMKTPAHRAVINLQLTEYVAQKIQCNT